MKLKFLFLSFVLATVAYAQGTWVQKANLPAAGRIHAVGFGIGTKGYMGTGANGSYSGAYSDFWEWDQPTNVWTQKADYAGGKIYGAVGFSIGAKGYIGTGYKGPDLTQPVQDFWEYDPSTNTWTQKANFGGTARACCVGFSIGAKGYVGVGNDGALQQEFWEWDQATNVWSQKTNFGGIARWCASGFSIGTKGYIGTGCSNIAGNSGCKDFWEWDQTTNAWTQKADYGAGAIRDGCGFSVGNYGYIGTGSPNASKLAPTNYFWQWSDSTCTLTASISTDDPKTVCAGYPVHLYAAGGSSYSWSTGATTAFIIASPTVTTTYILTGYSANGQCSGSISITITVNACNTAVSEINSASEQVVISPNPFNEYATIHITGGEALNGQMEVKVFDMLGKEVKSIIFSGEQVTLERGNLMNGVYFYRVIFKDQHIITGKFIVNE